MSDISDFMDFSPTRQSQVAACEKLRDTVHSISALHSSMLEGARTPSPKNSFMELYQMSTYAMARKKDELTGFGPTVYSIPSMGHFLKSRIYSDVTGLPYIVQPCLLFTTPAFFRPRPFFSPVLTFFSPRRCQILFSISTLVRPVARCRQLFLHAPPKSKICPLWLILPYQTPGTENSQTVTQKIHKKNTQ
ncbi:hypothetical protein TNCV_3537561 [Trichonephila clavipes]|nr:hypothetical protein TNCV_3537561 [Trichonephila clavipes]